MRTLAQVIMYVSDKGWGEKVHVISARKTAAKLAGNEQVRVRETRFFENPTSKSAYPENWAAVFREKIRRTLPPHHWRLTKFMTCANVLMEAGNLRKTYRRGGTVFSRETDGARFTAVDKVSFSVPELPSI